MTDRTVSIETSDHGCVEVPEPAWCTGEHPAGNLRAEIAHQGPRIDITVNTPRGPRRLLELLLWRDAFPAASYPHGDATYVVAQLLDGDHFGYDAAGLQGLATDLLDAARRVGLVARRLESENRWGDR